MTDDLELCANCSKGYLRPTAEAATAGESALNRLEKLVMYIFTSVIIVDTENLKQS